MVPLTFQLWNEVKAPESDKEVESTDLEMPNPSRDAQLLAEASPQQEQRRDLDPMGTTWAP